MNDTLHSTVPTTAAGTTLLDWLTARFAYLDAAGWTAAIAAGRVTCQGRLGETHTRLAAGDRIAYTPPLAPPPPPVAVVFLDDDLVVVDKPAHLVAHSVGAFRGNTFLPELTARLGGQPLHFVHRLDRETSGLLLLARRPAAVAPLQAQFAAGSVQKRYLAVAHGHVARDTVIDAPLGKATNGTIAVRRAVVAGGEAARTTVRVVRHLPQHSVLELLPHTGRTHQLRVHLAHLGHPLVGDPLYGRSDAQYLDYVAQRKADVPPDTIDRGGATRLLLHAGRLALRTTDGVAREFAAPQPPDFTRVLQALGGD